MHDGLDPTTIIFALVALFVVWKLRSVLGTRVDVEKRPPGENGAGAPAAGRSAAQDGNIIRLPGAAVRMPSTPARGFEPYARSDKAKQGLTEIVAADRTFDLQRFVDGAKMAYDMVVSAFASGDRATLANLVSADVLGSFSSEIQKREAAGEIASTKLVGIDSVEVVDAGIKNKTAQVTLRLETKLINAVKDRSGAIVTGDPDLVVTTEELWTFARDVESRDPTWRLIATESEPNA
mgnify:CR=1 FL=1